MNKYQKRIHRTVKEALLTFRGTAYEGSYYTVRKALKTQVKKLKQSGITDTKF